MTVAKLTLGGLSVFSRKSFSPKSFSPKSWRYRYIPAPAFGGRGTLYVYARHGRTHITAHASRAKKVAAHR